MACREVAMTFSNASRFLLLCAQRKRDREIASLCIVILSALQMQAGVCRLSRQSLSRQRPMTAADDEGPTPVLEESSTTRYASAPPSGPKATALLGTTTKKKPHAGRHAGFVHPRTPVAGLPRPHSIKGPGAGERASSAKPRSAGREAEGRTGV